jgi:hypothetical protein
LNEFDINTELWYIDCFAYSDDGGLNLDDMEWLCDFEADSQSITETVFPIKGYETLQNAFQTVETETNDSQNARDWSEQIIIARLWNSCEALTWLPGSNSSNGQQFQFISPNMRMILL